MIEKLERIFKKEDKTDPFGDREYAEESKRLFKILKEGEGILDLQDPKDRATYDIVTDVINFHKPEWRKKWVK